MLNLPRSSSGRSMPCTMVSAMAFWKRCTKTQLAHELTKRGLRVKQQERIFVHYDGRLVGEYYADILVEDKIILELKAAEELNEAFTAQLLNYLKATTCEVGYVMNFGPEPKYERRYFSNERKKTRQK